MITRRARLWIARGGGAALIGLFVILVASTWSYAGRIRAELVGVSAASAAHDETIVAVDDGSVTMPLDEATGLPGLWGLEFEGGHAELGDVVAAGDGVVTRRILRLTGTPTAGMPAVFDRMVFVGDPSSRGVPFEEVLVPGPLGDHAAWLGEGTDDTWVIFVHDRGADRREALRLLPAVGELGFPTLVITYRGDLGAPPGEGGLGLGDQEWPDLQAAVEFAVSAGAADVVLVGYGVGGSIVASFMRESRLASRVSGLVLDSPLLDAAESVDRQAIADKVPGFILQWAKGVATLRYGIDWSDLDHVARADEVDVPTLIIHGEGDSRYPVAVSRRYADGAPRLVELVVVPDAGHGEAWNVDPEAYEGAVAEFLGRVGAGEAAGSVP